jgi:SAM-dependent methyltransferase
MNTSCLICSAETYEKSDRKGRVFHFCTECFFISLDPRFYLTFEEERRRYELHNNDSGNDGYRNWLETFIGDAVRPNINLKSRILDFGSGPNPCLQEILINEGYSVDIYDKHFHDIPIIGLYDMITSTEVFEHVHAPQTVVKTLQSHLKPGGYLAIKTSMRPESDEDFLKWWYKEDKTHISFFSMETINFLASMTGLTVNYSDNHSVIIFRN